MINHHQPPFRTKNALTGIIKKAIPDYEISLKINFDDILSSPARKLAFFLDQLRSVFLKIKSAYKKSIEEYSILFHDEPLDDIIEMMNEEYLTPDGMGDHVFDNE